MNDFKLKLTAQELDSVIDMLTRAEMRLPTNDIDRFAESVRRDLERKFRKKAIDGRPNAKFTLRPHEAITLKRICLAHMSDIYEYAVARTLEIAIDSTL